MIKIKNLVNNNIFLLIISLLLTFLVYLPLLQAGFLDMDDRAMIVENDSIRNIKQSFSTFLIVPIMISTIYKLFGLSPSAFHLTGIIIHAINAFLLYLITKNLIGKKTAILSFLFFMLHPGVSEPVSWISGHTYLITNFFNFIIILFFIKYRKEKKILFFVFSLIFYAMLIALNRSPWVIVTPVLIFILDILFLDKKIVIDKKLLFLIPLIFYIIFIFFNQINARTGELDTYLAGTTRPPKIVAIGSNIGRSFSLLVFPVNLNVTYNFFQADFLNFILLFLYYLLLITIFYISFRKDKTVFGLVCLIYGSILPLFSPLNIAVNQAERYFYLAIAFYCILLGYFLVNIIGKKFQINYIYILILILPLFFVRTFIRSFDWKNDSTLWSAAEKSITNNYNVYNEMGNVYFAKNDLTKAVEYYNQALKLRPEYPTALHNLGLVMLKTNNIDEAQKYFESAILIDVNFYDSYYRLGQIAKYHGDNNKAKLYFEKALEIKKDFAPAREELQKIN